MRRPLALAVLPLVLLVAPLTGCTEPPSIPPAEPPSATEPLFASDEEALEAATEAYERYLTALDGLLQDPRSVSDEFDDIAGDEALISAIESVEQFVQDQVRTTGPRQIGSAELQQVIEAEESVEVVAYFCEDLTGVSLVDAQGQSLTLADRPDFSRFETTFVFQEGRGLVIDRQFWSNEASC